MKKSLILLFTTYFSLCQVSPAFAATDNNNTGIVQTLDNAITATVYSYKKTKYYTALEIGFTNPTDDYLEFTPTEIYLDDSVKYSMAPLSMNEIQDIERNKPSNGIVPGAIAGGLGIAAIGAGLFGNSGAAKGLGIAALGMGGATLLTKGLENRSRESKLITFENNDIDSIKRLPPGMTLGGLLFFPASKKPQSVTIVAKAKNGKYERKTFDLQNLKESKSSSRRSSRN